MITENETTPAWARYEEAARQVIENLRDLLGISSVEGGQQIAGASGAAWNVDALAWCEGRENFLVIEARRHTTSGLKQEEVAAVAFRIGDVGAAGGILVSPLPLQTGGASVARSSGIAHIKLSAESTPERYLAEYMGDRFHGLAFADSLNTSLQLQGGELSSPTTSASSPD